MTGNVTFSCAEPAGPADFDSSLACARSSCLCAEPGRSTRFLRVGVEECRRNKPLPMLIASWAAHSTALIRGSWAASTWIRADERRQHGQNVIRVDDAVALARPRTDRRRNIAVRTMIDVREPSQHTENVIEVRCLVDLTVHVAELNRRTGADAARALIEHADVGVGQHTLGLRLTGNPFRCRANGSC